MWPLILASLNIRVLFQWTVKCTVKRRLLETYRGPLVWILVIFFKELKRLSFSWRTDEFRRFVISPTLRDHQSYQGPLSYRIWQQIWKMKVLFTLWAFPLTWTYYLLYNLILSAWTQDGKTVGINSLLGYCMMLAYRHLQKERREGASRERDHPGSYLSLL